MEHFRTAQSSLVKPIIGYEAPMPRLGITPSGRPAKKTRAGNARVPVWPKSKQGAGARQKRIRTPAV